MESKHPIDMTADELIDKIRELVACGDQVGAARLLMKGLGLEPGSVPALFTELTNRF